MTRIKPLVQAARDCCQVAAWQWQAKQRRAARQAARDEKPGL